MISTPSSPNLNASDCALATIDIQSQILGYKYRLRPSKRQHADLTRILESQRELYNAALESRISCYAKTGKTLSHYDQCKELTELRKYADFSSVPANLQRGTLKRVDHAYKAFFRRLKNKEKKAGFPRFKGKNSWHSFSFREFSGITLRDRRLSFKGLTGTLRIKFHRKLPEGKLLSCHFGRDVKGWFVGFQVEVKAPSLPKTGKCVGVDVGLSSLAFLSDGKSIPNPCITRRHAKELRRRQRRMCRRKKGSNGRRKARESVARLHMRIRNSRATYLHQTSARLVREYDLIAVERLNVKGLASGRIAKAVNDAGWGALKQMLIYKAAKAGKSLIEVDPRNTTQACSGCGVIVPKGLKDRWHECPDCGLSLDRDENAARNILARSGALVSQDRALAHV